jgi:hypothetical protein
MAGNLQDTQRIETYYVQGEAADSVAIRFIEIAIRNLPNDYDRLRVLNYNVQKIMDKVNGAAAELNKTQAQEVPHGPAR